MKNYKFLIILMTLFVSFSCGEDFEDFNVDPTRPGGDTVPPLAVIPIMQTQTHRNLVSSAGRIAGIFMQQYEGFDAQQVTSTVRRKATYREDLILDCPGYEEDRRTQHVSRLV